MLHLCTIICIADYVSSRKTCDSYEFRNGANKNANKSIVRNGICWICQNLMATPKHVLIISFVHVSDSRGTLLCCLGSACNLGWFFTDGHYKFVSYIIPSWYTPPSSNLIPPPRGCMYPRQETARFYKSISNAEMYWKQRSGKQLSKHSIYLKAIKQ